MKISNEVLAAITLALHEHEGYTAHVEESGALTINEPHTEWNTKLCTQRRMPEQKF